MSDGQQVQDHSLQRQHDRAEAPRRQHRGRQDVALAHEVGQLRDSGVRRQVVAGLASRADAEVPTRILDVFCGVGFFTLALAGLADEAIGVEIVEASIIAARGNAALNHIENAYFYSGDARRTLPEVIDKHGAPGVVVLDPPRGGAGGKVMRRIARSGPSRIVYVSCNPTTLARDLKELVPFGYRIAAVEPIDLFPQTYHVETIVALDRR